MIHYDIGLFYICLYLQYHDALKYQNVGLITVVKRLYVLLQCREKWWRGKEEEPGSDKGIPVSTKLYHGK